MSPLEGRTIPWNGVEVRSHEHVDGRGGPQDLKGVWSEPLNPATNVLCKLDAEEEWLRCPASCSRTHSRRAARRVRRAIHLLSPSDWQHVVDALWVLRTVKTKDGRKRFGEQYRGLDFHILRHVLGTLPGLDGLERGETPPMDVTGGAAHTYTWHALFTLELETSLLIVDPTIQGLPYLDWGALRDPAVAELYRQRLGVGTALLSPIDQGLQTEQTNHRGGCRDGGEMFERRARQSDLGEMGSLDVLMAWEAYHTAHPRPTERLCAGEAPRSCEPRLLLDGSFARWPVPAFEWGEWYAGESQAVQALWARVNASSAAIVDPLIHRRQLRCNASGTSIYRHPTDRHRDDGTAAAKAARAALEPGKVQDKKAGTANDGQPDLSADEAAAANRPPVGFVVRGAGAFESIFVRRAGEWHRAVETCLGGMAGGLYQDVSECIEGRMAVNRFSIHFEAHFLGGDMGWAVLPHDPIFWFHHNGLDRLRRQWQSRHAHLKPFAYGYPISSPAYTKAYGTKVGLRDCLGCTAYDAGFTSSLLLGASDPRLASLPLSSGWLTNEDLLCVLDDLYTFDVILAEEKEHEGGEDEEAKDKDKEGGMQIQEGLADDEELTVASSDGTATSLEGTHSMWATRLMYAAGPAVALAVGLALLLAVKVGCLGTLAARAARLEARLAPWLVLGSAWSASLMSLTAGRLAAQGVPTPSIAAACGLVANALFVALSGAERDALRPPWGALLAQAVLGGALPHLAFFAIARLGLSVANCLMFTMPLWTAAFASLLAAAPWGAPNVALSSVSLLGVWLVARPSATVPSSLSGLLGGLGFGACGGLLNVLLGSASLRAASPALLNAWQMGASVAFALPSLLSLGHRALGPTPTEPHAVAALVAALGAVGVLMVVTSWLRTVGLQRAHSSAVATLLYTEIVWCFVYDRLLLGAHADALQLLGASLIIGGAATFALAPLIAQRCARSTYGAVRVDEEVTVAVESACEEMGRD